MAEPRRYRPVFSDLAAGFIISLPKRKQRRVLDSAYQLAADPSLRSDYTLADADGRPIEHLLVNGFVFTYWADHAECLVMITEIDDAE
jgi:hypothetical protein